MLSVGDKIGIVACSNALAQDRHEKIAQLDQTLRELGLVPVFSDFIFEKYSVFSGESFERAAALMSMYTDSEIKAVFDVSGGDVANELIEYLDFDVIRLNPKPYFGYSDLTTILNSVFTLTGITGGLYQIMNLVYGKTEEHIASFADTFMHGGRALLDLNCRFLQGDSMDGVAIGGNIRCFLKLAGTKYMPSFSDRILVLESLLGNSAHMATYIAQYKLLGAFKQVKGILLGSFTNMEKEQCSPTVEELLLKSVGDKSLPIAKTDEIGHQTSSKCVMIGSELHLSK